MQKKETEQTRHIDKNKSAVWQLAGVCVTIIIQVIMTV